VIINNAPANEAVLSNVGAVGEFRIRNSAKAFNILSSGLYANKIRAVIRELSCNAVDSHVAAGKQGTPFDVHLPTSLEPTFSIRDYGTGLNHEQVTNIYTTYFESSKTDSNDFIGALGLGSKSPFSYTDNFTVTAIKDGRKGVYTAFINEAGVPSIALMAEEETTDPAGVEVKFAVESRNDFYKFADEAQNVYRYFKLRPVVSGPDFEFVTPEYETENIVPGVHSYKRGYTSRAIMGNIAYPVDVPNAEQNLGPLAKLLDCGLEMHFGIGDLDFQASREGLSYIPQTIASIRRKLEEVNASLAVVVAQDADAIANHWERADWLLTKAGKSLWSAAVVKYITDTKFPLVDMTNPAYLRKHEFGLSVDELATKYNIVLSGFTKGNSITALKPRNEYVKVPNSTDTVQVQNWTIPVQNQLFFVINNTKVGALERAKFHWKNNGQGKNGDYVYVLVVSPADKKKTVDLPGFLGAIGQPPADRSMLVTDLEEKPRKGSATGNTKNVTILRLEQKGYGGYHAQRERVWRDAGKADSFDATKTYYYLPLSGFNVVWKTDKLSSAQNLCEWASTSGIPGLDGITVYGVRKTDHEWVAAQTNWVNIEDHLTQVLANIDTNLVSQFAVSEIDSGKIFKYNTEIVTKISADSVYAQFVSKFKDLAQSSANRANFERLVRVYSTSAVDIEAVAGGMRAELATVRNRYPLLQALRDYDINADAVAQYINLIDKEA
jgi:hypothetical protein